MINPNEYARAKGEEERLSKRVYDLERQCAEKDAEIEAAKELCAIYFEIAAAAIGEDQVRSLRDAALEQRILRGEE